MLLKQFDKTLASDGYRLKILYLLIPHLNINQKIRPGLADTNLVHSFRFDMKTSGDIKIRTFSVCFGRVHVLIFFSDLHFGK